MSLLSAIDERSEFGRWIKMKEPTTLDRFYKKAEEYMRVDDNPIPLQIIGGNQLLEAPKNAATQCDQRSIQGKK